MIWGISCLQFCKKSADHKEGNTCSEVPITILINHEKSHDLVAKSILKSPDKTSHQKWGYHLPERPKTIRLKLPERGPFPIQRDRLGEPIFRAFSGWMETLPTTHWQRYKGRKENEASLQSCWVCHKMFEIKQDQLFLNIDDVNTTAPSAAKQIWHCQS